ncbi:MAG: hypothetical protein HWD59_02100 [Coxiellaceae bacterium]|nr:MAG: hypothetical protein HWD59_02100 [Coxiellaceae bacterium]
MERHILEAAYHAPTEALSLLNALVDKRISLNLNHWHYSEDGEKHFAIYYAILNDNEELVAKLVKCGAAVDSVCLDFYAVGEMTHVVYRDVWQCLLDEKVININTERGPLVPPCPMLEERNDNDAAP